MWKKLLLIASIPAFAAPICAKEWNVLDPNPSFAYDLEGTIGKHPIRMHLIVSELYRCTGSHLQYIIGHAYSGWYEYVKVGKHIVIKGHYNSQGAGGASAHPPVELYESADGKNTGVFITTEDHLYDGKWQDFGTQQKTLRYSLHEVKSQEFHPAEVDDGICPKGEGPAESEE